MLTLQIGDMSEELFNALKSSADINRRSLSEQAKIILESALLERHRVKDKTKILNELRSYAHLFDGITIDMVIEDVRR